MLHVIASIMDWAYCPAMAEGYSWSASRSGRSNRLPGPDHLGWWAAAAMCASVLLHLIVFFALDRLKIAFHFAEAEELSTRPIDIRQIEVRPDEEESVRPPLEEVVTPPNDAASLLEEIDLLDKLPEDQDIDIKPQITDPEYALKLQNPAPTGEPTGAAPEISSGFEIDAELPELGREPESIIPAAVGQMTVDPGALSTDDSDIGKFTDDLIKQGTNGKVDHGKLDGMASLDSLLDLPPNVLIGKKTMLPSDLLFEFNSSVLRESAKLGLMKLGLLMDRNPNLYCWIEGHTDLVGGDEFNLSLSIKRAEAVKSYLVDSMHMEPAKVVTRGFGRYQPIITRGSREEQAGNRRVEIRMRRNPPSEDQMKIEPKKAVVIEEVPSPKAILVRPNRNPNVEPSIPPSVPPPAPKPPLKADPVEEMPAAKLPLKATPVEEIPTAIPVAPRATPVETPPLVAEPVEEIE